MNRSADWLHQAHADLDLAVLSAAAGHQAVEKALKALHLHHGQQAWGHGLGRSWRELPPAVGAALAEALSDLEDRLRIPERSLRQASKRRRPAPCPFDR